MPIPITRPSEVVLQLVALYQGPGTIGPTLPILWAAMARPIHSLPESFFPSYRLGGIDPNVPNSEFLSDVRELNEELLAELKDGRLSLTSIGRVLTIARELPESLQAMAESMEMARATE